MEQLMFTPRRNFTMEIILKSLWQLRKIRIQLYCKKIEKILRISLYIY